MNEKVEEVLALVRGEPGPFLEDDKSFFGKKRVDPSMKDAKMETDCGGMIITKSKMTYGEADQIAATVNLQEIMKYIKNTCNSWWPGFPHKCYWNPQKNQVFFGEMFWIIYSYLAYNRIIPGNYKDYDNTMEYLYDEILKRLIAANLVQTKDEIYFSAKDVF